MNEDARTKLVMDGMVAALREDGIKTPTFMEFVVLAYYMDDDGETRFWTCVPESQRYHQTMGLLRYASVIEDRRASDDWFQEA